MEVHATNDASENKDVSAIYTIKFVYKNLMLNFTHKPKIALDLHQVYVAENIIVLEY